MTPDISPFPAKNERPGEGPGERSSDERFLRRALALTGRMRAHPNPCVGAVVVNRGEIVGEGWTRSLPGVGLHAESMALEIAGERARGGTLYVTLEPCSHEVRPDGSTRYPCARRAIDAGISRVVCCLQDPDPQVDGSGFDLLRAAGITVEVGLLAEKARETHAPYLKHRTTGLPYITHKAAMSLDGKLAQTRSAPTSLTGPQARAAVHRLRDRVDAIVVGVGTILADDPQLNTRLSGSRKGRDPVVVVFDTHLRTPPTARVCRPGTILVTAIARASRISRSLRLAPSSAAEEGREGHDRGDAAGGEMASGMEVLRVAPDASGRPDVTEAMKLLAERGLFDVLLESGGALAASFWEAGWVDRALLFVAPMVLGGRDAPTPLEGEGLELPARLTKLSVRRYGEDVAISGEVQRQ